MRVRTIKAHENAHKPAGPKRHGRKYELPDREAAALIDAGLVEEDTGSAEGDDAAV